jgi:hypothetical protein
MIVTPRLRGRAVLVAVADFRVRERNNIWEGIGRARHVVNGANSFVTKPRGCAAHNAVQAARLPGESAPVSGELVARQPKPCGARMTILLVGFFAFAGRLT